MREDKQTIVVRDVPFLQYFFAVLFLAAGLATVGQGVAQGRSELLMPGCIGAGLATVLALVSPVITSTFDRRLDTYEVRRWGVLWSRVARGALAQITDVAVEEMTTETGYRVILLLTSAERLPLSSRWANTKRRSRRVAARLRTFLGAGTRR